MDDVTIRSAASRNTKTAPTSSFTGTVLQDALATPQGPSRTSATLVTFTPGARTNWHTHPEGQILYVVTGEGRAQREGGPIVEIGPGDVVYFAPNEKHWHGAGPDTFMVHVAINPANTTSGGTDWMEPVTDEEYPGDAG